MHSRKCFLGTLALVNADQALRIRFYLSKVNLGDCTRGSLADNIVKVMVHQRIAVALIEGLQVPKVSLRKVARHVLRIKWVLTTLGEIWPVQFCSSSPIN